MARTWLSQRRSRRSTKDEFSLLRCRWSNVPRVRVTPSPAVFEFFPYGWYRNAWHKEQPQAMDKNRWHGKWRCLFQMEGIWQTKNHPNLGWCRLRDRSPKGWCFQARQILRRSPQRYWLQQMLSCSTLLILVVRVYIYMNHIKSIRSIRFWFHRFFIHILAEHTGSVDSSQISRVTWGVGQSSSNVLLQWFLCNHTVTC